MEASYEGKTAVVTLKVLGDLAALELDLSRNTVSPGDQVSLTVTGIDRNGYRAELDSDAVAFADDAGLGQFAGGIWTAGPREGTTVLGPPSGAFGPPGRWPVAPSVPLWAPWRTMASPSPASLRQ